MELKNMFAGVKDGETFMVNEIEFIKFPDVDGRTPVVAKDILFRSAFGRNNNLKESDVLRWMETAILPRIIEAVGEENVCSFKTDLTTWDGLKNYGELESKISLPTMDFYRKNVQIFDRHKVNAWWWLATADSSEPHWNSPFVLCVSPSGDIYCVDFNFDSIGVRPFCIFKSSIFGSSEE